VAGVVLVLLAGYCYVRFGFVDPRADAQINSFESSIAMPALDAAVDRRASDRKSPVEPTAANLLAGMKIYQSNCSGCHGDIQHTRAVIGDAFYPRVPQFLEDAPDMPENQNFYITQHGVRLSGMPAWGKVLKEQEIWTVTTFLSHMDKLPPEVSAAWKTAASAQEGGSASNSGPASEMDKKKPTEPPAR
jgi:mono/diheme cytochrome c family protein